MAVKEVQDLKLNDLNEASVILGVSRRFTVQLVHERKIAHTRIGRKIFITNSAIGDFVRRNTITAIGID